MYSAAAANVAQLRTTVAALRQAEAAGDEDSPMKRLVLRAQLRQATASLEDAERRLIAERDPAQREALRQADEAERLETEQALSSLMRKLLRISTVTDQFLTAPAKRLTHNAFTRLAAMVQRAKDKREAVRLAFTARAAAVLVPKTINPSYFATGEITTEWTLRPLDLQVHSLIAAPRPGPRAGTALAA